MPQLVAQVQLSQHDITHITNTIGNIISETDGFGGWDNPNIDELANALKIPIKNIVNQACHNVAAAADIEIKIDW